MDTMDLVELIRRHGCACGKKNCTESLPQEALETARTKAGFLLHSASDELIDALACDSRIGEWNELTFCYRVGDEPAALIFEERLDDEFVQLFAVEGYGCKVLLCVSDAPAVSVEVEPTADATDDFDVEVITRLVAACLGNPHSAAALTLLN